MNTKTYTPEQMALASRFADAGKNTPADKQDMFEILMSAVLLGMEAAERNIQTRLERVGA